MRTFKQYIDEGKVKLKPGMNNDEYKACKAAALAPPKPKSIAVSKDTDSDDDSGKQLSQMLKGRYPWGNVSDQLARAAISKLRTTDPKQKVKAQAAIWANQDAFSKFIKEGWKE